MSLQEKREEALVAEAARVERVSAQLQVATFEHNVNNIETLNESGKTSGLMEYLRGAEGAVVDDAKLRKDLIEKFPELVVTDSWGDYPGMPFNMAGPLVKLSWGEG